MKAPWESHSVIIYGADHKTRAEERQNVKNKQQEEARECPLRQSVSNIQQTDPWNNTPLTSACVYVWLNIYANYTHKAHNHRCGIPNTCIMDGETIISVPFLASCVFMRQRCITFICTDTQVIRSLWMLEMTPGALDSFHVAGAELQSAHKPEQINSRQGLAEVSAANRFLISFERDKNLWIKPAWRK